MIAVIDVQYIDEHAAVGCLLFHSWKAIKSDLNFSKKVSDIQNYESGLFYKRELPCILSLLEDLDVTPDVVVIDGYVFLDTNKSPGLGANLFDALNQKIPVIGVAKNSFKDSPQAEKVYRGNSKKPLYVTAAGIDQKEAAENIKSMHDEYRFPTLLKDVDSLAREFAKEIHGHKGA